MSFTEIDDDGFKRRKLVELRQTAGKEYQDAMLNRVNYFTKEYSKDSIFSNMFENTFVKGMSALLDLKVKLDEALGENKEKVQDAIEKLLLLGL